MNRIPCALLCALLSVAARAGEPPAAKIALVEAGLRPPNAFRGEPGWTLQERMEHYGVPGVGIAVIEDYQVAWYRVYGLADRETGEPVRKDTLFQAGSISKPVAAFGAMKLVELGNLTLDDPVNDRLETWKIPENDRTRSQPVTLTHLTSHTGGLTVHGFPGYAVGDEVPTLVQVLDGAGPANTAPIRVDQLPGEGWRYSGGGYTVMQQLMIDVSGEPFPQLMQRLVLGPVHMRRSTFAQPLPPKRLKHAAAGILPDGTPVEGKRHTYPEMAAAGLWTTAEDLARFAAEVQRALQGRSKVLSKEMAEKMVEPVVPEYGRGFGLVDAGGAPYFSHGGWDEGFCAQLTAHRDAGYGVAVMINSNHPEFLDEVVRAAGIAYGWEGYGLLDQQPIPDVALETYPGRYRYNGEQSFTLERQGDRIFMQYVGDEPQELIYTGDGVYVRRERGTRITFVEEDGAPVFQFILGGDGRQSHTRLADDERTAREILASGDHDGALAAYRALQEEGDAAGSEDYLNRQGLSMVERGEHDLGLALLLVNCELYPGSANTWDSVGWAYREAGDREKAVEYYREALEVDPEFPSAVRALSELGGS